MFHTDNAVPNIVLVREIQFSLASWGQYYLAADYAIMKRLILGFVLGGLLGAQASSLIGVGHGTLALLGFSSSLLGLLLDVGIIIPLLGTPFLWAAYFLLIPDIDSRGSRLATLAGVIALHLLIGLWFMSDDVAVYQLEPTPVIWFFVLFVISIGLLIFVSMRRRFSG